MELIDFVIFELFLETFLECLLSVSDITMMTLIIIVIMATNTYGMLTTCQAPAWSLHLCQGPCACSFRIQVPVDGGRKQT